MTLSVLIPAHDEADYISDCLTALLASDPLPTAMACEILVLANGCTDTTAQIARGFSAQSEARGWRLKVHVIDQGGKLNALNVGDRAAQGRIRVYLDADVVLDPPLLGQLATVLDCETARYASGRPRVALARSPITRAYARFWQKLPFLTDIVPGFGVFAMNASGRARWADWPQIISDDTFARLQFSAEERVSVPAGYDWPMVEGFAPLVRVRRRQNRGVDEIARDFPALLSHEDKQSLTIGQIAGLAARNPVGFIVYALVAFTVKTPLFASASPWARGR